MRGIQYAAAYGSIVNVSGILDRPPQCAIAHKADDDNWMCVCILAARCARSFAGNLTLQNTEGAGKTGCALHPRSRVRLHKTKLHTSIQVQRKHSGLPRAMALRITSCSPRWPAFLPPSFAKAFASTHLTPAPGRQAHTTSPYAIAALVSRSLRVHRALPLVCDDGLRPLCGTGWRSW